MPAKNVSFLPKGSTSDSNKKHKNFDTLIARLIVAGLMFCLLQILNEPQLCNDTCLQLLNLYLGQ